MGVSFQIDYNFKTIRFFLRSRGKKWNIRFTWKLARKSEKKYIDEGLNPAKVNVIDPEKENYKPPPTIDKVYYYELSSSVDDDYELHLIRPTNSCFVNTYFDTGLWNSKWKLASRTFVSWL